MSLVKLPKELLGLSFDIGETKLPDTATPEQVEAFKELQKRIEQAQCNMCIIEE